MLALWMLCSAEAQGRRPENGREADGGSGAKRSGRRPLFGHSEVAWSGRSWSITSIAPAYTPPAQTGAAAKSTRSQALIFLAGSGCVWRALDMQDRGRKMEHKRFSSTDF